MITKFKLFKSSKNVKTIITKFKLFESPDYIMELDLSVENGIPFAVNYNDKVVIGEAGNYHYDVGLGKNSNMKYPGRIWPEAKVISFWVYPSVKKFKNILNQLENILKIKIFNNNWLIEVYETNDGIAGIDVKAKNNYFFDNAYRNYDGIYKLIPVEEYIGSKNVPEKERAIHLLSWAEKQALKKKGWGKGFGSDLTAWDSKNPLSWRQAKYQESKEYKY